MFHMINTSDGCCVRLVVLYNVSLLLLSVYTYIFLSFLYFAVCRVAPTYLWKKNFAASLVNLFELRCLLRSIFIISFSLIYLWIVERRLKLLNRICICLVFDNVQLIREECFTSKVNIYFYIYSISIIICKYFIYTLLYGSDNINSAEHCW